MTVIEQCRTAALGDMFCAVRTASRPRCPTTPAATGIVPSVRPKLPSAGWKPVRPISFQSITTMWSSRCRPISDIAYYNKAVVYGLLFEIAAETLITIAADPKHLGAEVQPLWSCTLGFGAHPPSHVHGIVPGGGLSPDGKRWVSCKPGFFLSVRVLSRLFRRRFLEALEEAHRADKLQFFGDSAELADLKAFARWLAPLRKIEWVVYAKRPFAGPAAVLAYLSRYTHRVAIANSRLLAMDEQGVTFRWKDYRDKSNLIGHGTRP